MTTGPEILRFKLPVVLVGPADINFDALDKLLARGFPLVAADGGANRLLNRGLLPKAIIGDHDSLDKSLPLGPETRLVKLEEQDTTDFEKCLYMIDAPLFLAFGFTGKRLDHTLATLHAMVKYHGVKNVLLIGSDDISLVQKGDFGLPMAIGQTVSIFPLNPIAFLESSGLEYAMDGLQLAIGETIGTSNRTIAEWVRISPAPAHRQTPYCISLPGNTFDALIALYFSI